MTNGTDKADALAFLSRVPSSDHPDMSDVHGWRDRTGRGQRQGAHQVVVVWGGSGTGSVLAPNRYRPGDDGGFLIVH